jgi:hypothetical protein
MSKRMVTSLFLKRVAHLCCALYKAARPWVSIGTLNTTGLRKESIISQISLPMCDNANWVVGTIAFQSGRINRTSECSIDKPNGKSNKTKTCIENGTQRDRPTRQNVWSCNKQCRCTLSVGNQLCPSCVYRVERDLPSLSYTELVSPAHSILIRRPRR